MHKRNNFDKIFLLIYYRDKYDYKKKLREFDIINLHNNNKFKVSIRRNYICIKTIKKFNAIFLSYKTNTKKIIGHLNKKNIGKR